ncbi:MAG: hypothetical protein OXR68_01230 [Alphaproteobacteria bacterium]|nr:hypothetical protein [Alphaproteobacteria bacterium]MDD9919233.1 hypothetical protein [Alphaproteobacteria bacterium]
MSEKKLNPAAMVKPSITVFLGNIVEEKLPKGASKDNPIIFAAPITYSTEKIYRKISRTVECTYAEILLAMQTLLKVLMLDFEEEASLIRVVGYKNQK